MTPPSDCIGDLSRMNSCSLVSILGFLLRTEIGQEAGICTRTVSFTGRDAANYTTILMEPLVGLAPTNTSLRNSSCGCRGTEANGVHGRNCTCDLHLRTVALSSN